jgi:hypothetical protein
MRLTPAIYKYSTLTDGQISGARHVQVDCKATLHGGIRRSLMDVSNLCGLSNTVPNVKPADRFDHFVCSERVLGLPSSNFITRLTDRLTPGADPPFSVASANFRPYVELLQKVSRNP